MKMVAVVIAVMCAGSCVLLKKKSSGSSSSDSSDSSDSSGPKSSRPKNVVSEKSGSKVVGFYNTGHRALVAAKAAIGEDDYDTAGWEYLAARKAATDGKKFVKKLKKSGNWAEGLTYKTEFDDDPLSEEAMLAALDELADKASSKWDKHKDDIHKAWKREYGAVTDEQLEKLEELGKPTKTKADKKGACWFFENDSGDKEKYCWTKKGKLAEHTQEKAPEPEEPEEPKDKQVSAEYVKAASELSSENCSFGNCYKDGWTVRGAEGTHTIRCSFGNCLKDGWTTSHPDGSTTTTRCLFNDCMKDGWTVSLTSGKTITCRCSFNDCGQGYRCD